jgi:glucosamine kinase
LKNDLLIADVGGTSSDWCLLKSCGNRLYFKTESYHPSQFSSSFLKKMKLFWKKQKIDFNTKILFFGAGCSSPSYKEIIANHFKECGFKKVEVESDLYGICLSLSNGEPIAVSILGTGSVYANFDGEKITKLSGGLGYLIGDEGSGYGFGRKLISQLLNNELHLTFSKYLYQQLGNRENILEKVYGKNGKNWLSSLPIQLNNLEFLKEIEHIHHQNISEFLEKHFQKNMNLKKMYFVGSYAFHYLEYIKRELLKKNISVSEFIEKPIQKMTNYFENQQLVNSKIIKNHKI